MPTALHYGRWMPPDFSVHGAGIDRLIWIMHGFMLLLFVPWGLFFIYCLVRFRQRAGHAPNYKLIKAKPSKVAEVLVAVIEVILLAGFSMPVWAEYKNKPPAESERFEVHVLAQQFQWNAHYAGKDGIFGRTDARRIGPSNPIGLVEDSPGAADDIVTVNEMHLPVDRPIYLRLTSRDVIHSFDIPTLRVKQDVIPGMEIPIWFKIEPWATSDAIREKMTEVFNVAGVNWYRLRHHIAVQEYKDKGGAVLLAKGDDLGATYAEGTEKLERLAKAGIEQIQMQPRVPLEVVCAQLCGNSHFKMKAQLFTHTADSFKAWVEEKSKKVELKQDF